MPSNSNAAMVALGSAFIFALLPLGIVEVNSHGMVDRVSEALDKDSGKPSSPTSNDKKIVVKQRNWLKIKSIYCWKPPN